MFLLVYLIVLFGFESILLFAGRLHKRFCITHMGLNIYQLAYLLSDGLVEIEQIVPALLEERPQVVLVIVKERRLAIGTLNSIPVQMSPVAMVADAEVLYQHGVTMFYWHRECLDTIGG